MKEPTDSVNGFSEYFWFHWLSRCPKCHGKLMEVGYVHDFIYQSYKCNNKKCGWGW